MSTFLKSRRREARREQSIKQKWTMTKRPKRFPIHIGKIVEDFFQKKGWNEKLKEYQIWTHWEEVMGKKLADRCQPLHVRYGVLTIGVSNSTWLTELQFMKLDLLGKIKKVFGIPLTEIRFKIVENSKS